MPKLWTETVESHRLEVRAAILDAAGGVVVRRGLLALSMSTIAEAAGIGRATLYKYFPDTEAVLAAWHERHVTRHVAELTALRDQGGPPQHRLRSVLLGYGHICQERGRHGGTDLSAALHRGEVVQQLQQQLLDLVTDLLGEAAAAGVVRDDVPPAQLAAYCVHALGAAGESAAGDVSDLVDLVWSALVARPGLVDG